MKPLRRHSPYEGCPVVENLFPLPKGKNFLQVRRITARDFQSNRIHICTATKEGHSFEVVLYERKVDDLVIKGALGALDIPNSCVKWLKENGYKLTTNR